MGERYSGPQADERELVRLVAPNPSPMTGDGTNSYVLGTRDVAIIDPGPAINSHLDALRQAVAGRPVRAILVTHSHLDHSPGAGPLSDGLGAPVLAFGPSDAGRSDIMQTLAGKIGGGEGVDQTFAPDQQLRDGDIVEGNGWTLRAHHTPGHMANHMSFEWIEQAEVFTGDTVMEWASTLISPPDGDLGQFMRSMDRLAALDAKMFHPGHGAPVPDPTQRCHALRDHRLGRERAILDAMASPQTIPDLVATIYADTPATLHPAAARNVLAQLVHLWETGAVTATPDVGPDAIWTRV